MKTEKSKYGQSVLRKLVPAAAMLTVSALMLSTATYAWFTMNKEVQMTGLNMSATASEGIEISLGGVDAAGTLAADLSLRPGDGEDEKGWRSAVVVGNYYSDIGKMKPASSADAVSFFDSKNASDKGRVATEFEAITLDPNQTMSALTQRAQFTADGVNTADGDAGYYVDIPVHIRTSKLASATETSGDIYCKLIIRNEDANKDLYKAVRVAFIPVDPLTGTTKIFACNDEYYGAGAVDSASTKAAVTVIKSCVTDAADFVTGTGEDSGLDLPYAATPGTYGHLDFKVRIWLEGESKSCYDDKAGQAWQISLAFALDEFESTP